MFCAIYVRYKIYVEGNTWSVSEKYILACDSVTLLVKPDYYDFYSRGLMPLKHYWPVNNNDKCRSIKHAVHWGNTHQKEVMYFNIFYFKFYEIECSLLCILHEVVIRSAYILSFFSDPTLWCWTYLLMLI